MTISRSPHSCKMPWTCSSGSFRRSTRPLTRTIPRRASSLATGILTITNLDVVVWLSTLTVKFYLCSLGGAVAVRVAATEKVASLVGVMVIDVVEGTAVASLTHMHRILASRPKSFTSTEEAVNWALHTGTVRNAAAAAVSVPSQLVPRDDGHFTWRTDLKKSSPYWRGTVQYLSGSTL
jgi:hypothetical protein